MKAKKRTNQKTRVWGVGIRPPSNRLGAIGAGFFLIPAVGFAWTVGFAAALNLLLAVGVAFLGQGVARRVLVAGLIGMVLLAFLPPRTPWRLLRFAYLTRRVLPGQLIFDRVGRSSTVLVLYRKGAYYVTNNGLPEAGILPADDSSADLTNRWLGALPTLARPDSESLLVIGLGGGLVIEHAPVHITHGGADQRGCKIPRTKR